MHLHATPVSPDIAFCFQATVLTSSFVGCSPSLIISKIFRSPSERYSGGSGWPLELSANDLILENRGDREKGFRDGFKEAKGEMRLDRPRPSDRWKVNADAAMVAAEV